MTSGFYKKYGLDVKLMLPPGEFPGAIEMGGQQDGQPDIAWTRRADGHRILANRGQRLQIATTDVRFAQYRRQKHEEPEEIKGKRLDLQRRSDDGFIYAPSQAMGWVPRKDFTVVEPRSGSTI